MSGSLFAPSYYTITINNVTGAAPADGFVDAVPLEKYITVNSDNLPTDLTYDLSSAKKRANKRYKQILEQLEQMANCYVSMGEILPMAVNTTVLDPTGDQVITTLDQTNTDVTYSSISAPGASYKTEATSITFVVTVERGDDVLVTRDENNIGVFLSGTAAIKRCIARALIETQIYNTDVFDPSNLETPGNTSLLPRFGDRIVALTVGAPCADIPTAEALITVATSTTP